MQKLPPSQRLDNRYEALTAEILRRFSPGAEVAPNLKIRGKSGRRRQIDVGVRSTIAGQPIFVAFECKHYARPVALKQVEELIGKIEDVRAQLGVLVSDSGFDEGAVARAREHGRIQLCQLVDSTQGWLKTKLSVQIVVSFVNLTLPYEMALRRITTRDGPEPQVQPLNAASLEDRLFIEAHIKHNGLRVIQDFHRWTNEQVSLLADGYHEKVIFSRPDSDEGVQWTFRFHRTTDTFSSDDVFVGAAGLFDSLHDQFTLGEAGSFTLEESSIRTTWTPRPASYSEPRAKSYRRLGSDPISAAEEVVRGILASVRGGA